MRATRISTAILVSLAAITCAQAQETSTQRRIAANNADQNINQDIDQDVDQAAWSQLGETVIDSTRVGGTQLVATVPSNKYADRIIDSGQLASLPPDEDETDALDPGLPRSLQIDLIHNRADFEHRTTRESGVALDAFWDTTNLGSFSANALVFRSDRNGDSQWRGTASVWQRGLSMPGGWSVNNGLGVQNTPLPNVLRQPYRFFLPSTPFAGISSEWNQRARGLQWQAAIGRGGSFSGARFSGFDLGDGNLLALNTQWAWSPQASAAIAVLATDGRIVPKREGLPGFQNGKTTSVLFGQHWQGTEGTLDLSIHTSRSAGKDASGIWFDAFSPRGAYSHHYGLFYLQPDLAWGALPINNDLRGGYYRIGYQRARWSWNAGIDRIASISGSSFDGSYANASTRYQASPRYGFGSSASVRDSTEATAYSLQIFADHNAPSGQTRAQLDYADNGIDNQSWQLLLDHAFPLKQGERLSLSAGYGVDRRDAAKITRSGILAAYGGFDLTDTLSIDGSARWTHGDGPEALRSTDLNLAVNWQLSTRWRLSGTLYQNQGSQRSPFNLDPLADPNAFTSLPRDRAIYIALHYAHASGHRQQVLGGNVDSPAGSIAGSVFLDDNGDGIRSAAELPAANVTVILDDRFQARTDAQGRFEFPNAASGTHHIEIMTDNLPLPWFIDSNESVRSIEVEVRRRTVVDIGAKRQR